jgi:XRE family transcriptional regulator, fatty acid utilization regulator
MLSWRCGPAGIYSDCEPLFRRPKNLAFAILQDIAGTGVKMSEISLAAQRLSAFRRDHNITQDDLAAAMGLPDRQSVSSIEAGDRKLKPSEFANIVSHFKVDPDYFLDPYRLVGEGDFNWRQVHVSVSSLVAYQARAGAWLAAYRALSVGETRPGPPERKSLRLHRSSSYELAMAEGERITRDYNMGDVPALRLPGVMQDDFGILVLMVDMEQNISGAACRLPELDAVLVNRNENPGRRNFDLAHEFFHILTWDRMPPKPVETARETGGSRIEQLANAFASALLMPRHLLEKFGEWARLGDAERAQRMRMVADKFKVSVSALYWRLVTLKLLSRSVPMVEVPAPDQASYCDNPPPFSKAFMEVMANAIRSGRISVAKLSKVLDVPRFRLSELFQVYSIPIPETV